VAEHESKGESVLPIAVLTDLVRSYTTQAHSVVPQFLAASFEMLRDSQSKMMENFSAMPTPMNPMSGFEAMQRQQKAFLSSMMPGWQGAAGTGPQTEPAEAAPEAEDLSSEERQELEDIKAQLAELKEKMTKLGE
jgi:polyhydroxyalkanoate synthesis regulator protein